MKPAQQCLVRLGSGAILGAGGMDVTSEGGA